VQQLIKKVTEYIEEHSMLQYGDKILVALSGGPDSICLLHMLEQLKETYNIQLYAAHVNHCLRGDESEGDEKYVKSFCDKVGIPLYIKRVDINKYAKEKNLSSETAGREVRYSFFKELMIQLNGNKVALAHNANDQAETLLMRIMRGTGIDGLKGILPVRDNIFIRPILCLNRSEIECYCEENNLKPRIDSSNLENIYNRNKVRLELIPYIQKNFNPDIIKTLNRFAELATVDSNFIEELAEEKYNIFAKKLENKVVLEEHVFGEKEAVLSRIIRKAIINLLGTVNNFDSNHIYDIISLQRQGTGKRIMLPYNVVAENIYSSIHLYINNKEDNKSTFDNFNSVIRKDDLKKAEQNNSTLTVSHEELGVLAEFRILHRNEELKFNADSLTKYFSYDNIEEDIIIRIRKDGDRFFPYGMKGQKKLKDYFIDLKIPKDERSLIPLLCIDNKIAWVIGYRTSDDYKVTKETKKILEVRIIGRGKYNEK
jgi:tRNA(Ile)-lysidine synthase